MVIDLMNYIFFSPHWLLRLTDYFNYIYIYIYYDYNIYIYIYIPCRETAVIVVHGVDRDADEYYCCLKEAASLQNYFPGKNVGIIAPSFMELPDGPSKGILPTYTPIPQHIHAIFLFVYLFYFKIQFIGQMHIYRGMEVSIAILH